ncbi:MAG TPA: plastocyanin/azurin family copper-binding protein [Dehalococcoidia bacterium]
MKLDLTRLPVGEMIVGFLIVSLLATFILAFTLVDSGTDATDEGVTDVSGTATPSGPSSGGIDVVMGDNFFDPSAITIAAGDTVTFNLTNEGVAIHNMRTAGEDAEYNTEDDAVSDPDLVTGGGLATLEWTAPDAPGEILFRCDFHPIDMIGTITVQ